MLSGAAGLKAAHESLKLRTGLGNRNSAFPKPWWKPCPCVVCCSPSAGSPSTCQMAPRKAAVTAGLATTSPPAGPARPSRCPWASPRMSSTSRRPPTAAPRATATPTPSPVSAELCSSSVLQSITIRLCVGPALGWRSVLFLRMGGLAAGRETLGAVEGLWMSSCFYGAGGLCTEELSEEVNAAALMVINTVLREFTFLTFPALLCAVV